MSTTPWNWKSKDGNKGGLLYESGNWGDLLKLLWLTAIARWKGLRGQVDYFDPFAGDVDYPLGRKTGFRFSRAGTAGLDYIRRPFVDRGRWPSSASAMACLGLGGLEVFDADPDRRGNWARADAVRVLDADSGWTLLREREPEPSGLWLLDPYDFLAEWRDVLPTVVKKANGVSVLLYIYNRSARREEAFRDYRMFRNALDDLRGDAPKCLGRVAADGFLPRSHHEMLFLPGPDDAGRPDFADLLRDLEEASVRLTRALRGAEVFESF